jgi:hypothetical protein
MLALDSVEGARAPLGVVCGKPRGNWMWFSEPPNKELGGAVSINSALYQETPQVPQ